MKDFLFLLDPPEKDELYERISKEDIANKSWTFLGGTILALLGAIGIALYAINNYSTPKPAAVFEVKAGQTRQILTVDSPHQSFKNVAAWLTDAIQASYTLSFDKYNEQVANAEYYFTKEGYETYKTSMKTSGVIDQLIKQNMEISIVTKSDPVFINGGVNGKDSEWWRFRTPVLVSYYAGKEPVIMRYTVNVLIVKVPSYENIKGLAIAEFNMSQDN